MYQYLHVLHEDQSIPKTCRSTSETITATIRWQCLTLHVATQSLLRDFFPLFHNLTTRNVSLIWILIAEHLTACRIINLRWFRFWSAFGATGMSKMNGVYTCVQLSYVWQPMHTALRENINRRVFRKKRCGPHQNWIGSDESKRNGAVNVVVHAVYRTKEGLW